MKKIKCKYLSVLVSVGLAVLLLLVQANAALAAATAPSLGAAASFGVLGASTVTNASSGTVVYGNLGVSPGTAITGFPPGIVTWTIHAADGVAAQAQIDARAAYDNLAGQTPFVNMASAELGGLTLLPGIYRFSSSAQLTGTLILDAQNDPASVFIFQIGSSLTTASGSKVVVINAPENWCNKYFQVGTSATLGTGTEFIGTIIADQSITLNTGARLDGRAFALIGAVTLDNNKVSGPICSFPAPTLSGWGLILLTGLLVSVGFLTLRKSGRLRLG